MKKEKYNIELECLMQDEVLGNNGIHRGSLILEGSKGSFIEAAPSHPHTRNPKPLDGRVISLVQKGATDFNLGIKKLNPYYDENPLATIAHFSEEYMKAWNITHNKA